MATKTHAAYGDKMNMRVQAAGVFATHMNRNGTMAKLTGKMPKVLLVLKQPFANKLASTCLLSRYRT